MGGVIKLRPKSQVEMLRDLADVHESEGRVLSAEGYRARATMLDALTPQRARELGLLTARGLAPNERPAESPGRMFICGDIDIQVCGCGYAADFLCDGPVGGGKTCDIPLCADCRTNIGLDTDLCRVHAAGWQPSGACDDSP